MGSASAEVETGGFCGQVLRVGPGRLSVPARRSCGFGSCSTLRPLLQPVHVFQKTWDFSHLRPLNRGGLVCVPGCIEKFRTVSTELGIQAHKETLTDSVFPEGCLEVFLPLRLIKTCF